MELAAREDPDSEISPWPTIAEIERATGVTRETVLRAVDALVEAHALKVTTGPDGKRVGYRTFVESPERRGIFDGEQQEMSQILRDSKVPVVSSLASSGSNDPPDAPTPSGPRNRNLGTIGMLAAVWAEVYRDETGLRYHRVGADTGGLKKLAQVAELRQWGRTEAEAYFRAAIAFLRKDRYWKDRISIQAAAFKVNEVMQATSRIKQAERLDTDSEFDAVAYRKSIGLGG